jgi:FKBP-type peptidyl-prolyl cis-trans isomerase SlyD
MFCINGHFDHEHIYKDAIVPLQNDQGERFNGRVLEIGEEKVKMDLNHPLAGETLYFEGTVLENREATKEEVDHMMKHLTGGCGGHCDSCGGGCDHDDCGCGHDHDHEHHHDGCGCGHCH